MTGARGHPPDTAVTRAAHNMNIKDPDTVALDPDPTITATEAAATMIPIGVDPDHSTDCHTTISQETEAPAPITAIMIHHTTDNPPVGIPPEITADLTTDPEGNIINCPEDLHGSLKIKSTNMSPLMIHHQTTTVQMTVIGHQIMRMI